MMSEVRVRNILPLLCLVCYSAHGQVLINEVLFYPDPVSQDASITHQWLELFNAGTDPV
jgi:hypothetical protein